MKNIPQIYTNMNVYNQGDKMIGVESEITLPNLEPMTETLSGAGIAGEFDVSLDGHFGALQIEIPFRIAHEDAYALAEPGRKTIVLRSAIQVLDQSKGINTLQGVKITVGGTPKGIDLGKIAIGKPGESKVTLEVLYLKVEIDGEVKLELDKLSMIYIVNGVDYLATQRNLM